MRTLTGCMDHSLLSDVGASVMGSISARMSEYSQLLKLRLYKGMESLQEL